MPFVLFGRHSFCHHSPLIILSVTYQSQNCFCVFQFNLRLTIYNHHVCYSMNIHKKRIVILLFHFIALNKINSRTAGETLLNFPAALRLLPHHYRVVYGWTLVLFLLFSLRLTFNDVIIRAYFPTL